MAPKGVNKRPAANVTSSRSASSSDSSRSRPEPSSSHQLQMQAAQHQHDIHFQAKAAQIDKERSEKMYAHEREMEELRHDFERLQQEERQKQREHEWKLQQSKAGQVVELRGKKRMFTEEEVQMVRIYTHRQARHRGPTEPSPPTPSCHNVGQYVTDSRLSCEYFNRRSHAPSSPADTQRSDVRDLSPCSGAPEFNTAWQSEGKGGSSTNW